MMTRDFLFYVLILGGLLGCTLHKPLKGTAIDEMQADLKAASLSNQKIEGKIEAVPSRVENAMLPDLTLPALVQKSTYKPRFDIAVKEVPAKTFFMSLVKDTPYSMVIDPAITGVITLNLKHVTIDEVLQTVTDVYGYEYRKIPSGYEILPHALTTRMFSVNYLDLDRRGESHTSLNSGQITQGASDSTAASYGATGASSTSTSTQASASTGRVETQSDINFWKKLQESLIVMIGEDPGKSVMVDSQAGLVIVRAYPSELKQVADYLDLVQNTMNRQVILEAKILEVVLSDRFQMGIDWKIFGANLNALNTFPGTTIDQSQFSDAFTAQINWVSGDFETTIQALSTQGNVQVLSSPRVATLNNQKAVIKVGSDAFFVTDVSTSTTQTVNSVTPTQDIELTPFFSGITLDVTPQIDKAGNVTLHIHPTVSQVQDETKQVDLGTQVGTLTLPLAMSKIRESDTVVHARNGQVVVIGGLMSTQTVEDIAGLPFFGNIPFLGTLLRNTKQTQQKSELVILLRPVVVTDHVLTEATEHASQSMQSMKQGFHIGGRPDVFGTEAETSMKLGKEVPKTQ